MPAGVLGPSRLRRTPPQVPPTRRSRVWVGVARPQAYGCSAVKESPRPRETYLLHRCVAPRPVNVPDDGVPDFEQGHEDGLEEAGEPT